MDQKPLISVIVPIYNVEKYLSRCIDSIINQSYSNLEIILVDDGSPDQCPDICDAYAAQDSRIKVIHKPNGGLSSARNAGLNIMLGDYVAFIDSDDFVHREFIKFLYNMSRDNQCEISQCSYQKGKLNDFTGISFQSNTVTLNKIDAFLSRKLRAGVVARLYQASLFRKERFPVGKQQEDEAVTYKIAYMAEKIAFSENKLYYYFQSPVSIMRNQKHFQSIDFIPIFNERLNFFQNKEKKLFMLSKEIYCLVLILFYARCKKDIKNTNDKEQIVAIFKNLFSSVIKYPGTLFKNKIIFLIFYLSPNLCSFFVNRLKK